MALQYQYIAKIVLVGHEGIGKTNLASAFTTLPKQYKFQENLGPTVGVEFSTRFIGSDGNKGKLQVWDTSGQERFKQVSHSYFRGVGVFLLCFDYTNKESLKKLKDNYLKQIKEAQTSETSFILVGTKADDPRDIGIEKEIEAFIQSCELEGIRRAKPTSAKNQTGIDELVNLIGDELKQKNIYGYKIDAVSSNQRSSSEKGYSIGHSEDNFFTPKSKMMMSYGAGLTTGVSVFILGGLVFGGMLSLNPITLPIVMGVLAVATLVFTAYAAYQSNKCESDEYLSGCLDKI